MSQHDLIQYAERLYAAIRGANFSPLSFLAFGNSLREGVPLRSMPRIALEPFMKIVGEMVASPEGRASGSPTLGAVATVREASCAPEASQTEAASGEVSRK